MKNQHFPYHSFHSYSGNAIVFVLIVIALIAALTMTITRSSQQTITNSGLQAGVAAQSILRQAKSIETAIQSLLQRGCSESEISFENPIEAGFTNASSPTNLSCHVFRMEGAGLSWPSLANGLAHTPPDSNAWRFDATNQVLNVGTDCAQTSCNDMLMVVNLKLDAAEVCYEINNLLGLNLTTIPTDTNIDTGKFIGSFGSPPALVLGDETNSAALAGKNSGCFLNSTGNYYTFYDVLIAR